MAPGSRNRSRPKGWSRPRQRNRNRNRVPSSRVQSDVEEPNGMRPAATPAAALLDNKAPREELPYTDFYTDLNIDDPLPVIMINSDDAAAAVAIESDQPSVAVNGQSAMADDADFSDIQPLERPRTFVDRAMASAGFQENQPFCPPKHGYFRFRENMIEVDRVEYDMDEQDDCWLQEYNERRRKGEERDELKRELFEIVLTKIEKEWFEIEKRLPHFSSVGDGSRVETDSSLLEDSKCNICDDGDCENSNAIIFCDGCNLAVHQDCYGVPYIPEGQWLCRKCSVSPHSRPLCALCPGEGGPLKQTVDSQWAHVLCAFWIPEVGFRSHDFMEPIEGLERIPKSRWKLCCYICQKRFGACIQCSNKSCFQAFHATCARRAKFYMQMKSQATHYLDSHALTVFCDKHTPFGYARKVNVSVGLQEARRYFASHSIWAAVPSAEQQLQLQQQQQQRQMGQRVILKVKQDVSQVLSRTPGVMVPELILLSLFAFLQKYNIRKRLDLAIELSKYWSLKRESRRGASLLKRLAIQLESERYKFDEKDLEERYQCALMVRNDLEHVQEILDRIQSREREKSFRQDVMSEFIGLVYFPIKHMVKPLFDRLVSADADGLFVESVTSEEAPDYYHIISQPMCWSIIRERLDGGEYTSLKAFSVDVELIFLNAMTYNAPDTIFYKTAVRLRRLFKSNPLIFKEVEVDETIRWSGRRHRSLDIGPHEEAEGLTVDIDPYPGKTVREMSPLTDDEPFISTRLRRR